jgi:hypothetical protein
MMCEREPTAVARGKWTRVHRHFLFLCRVSKGQCFDDYAKAPNKRMLCEHATRLHPHND